MPTNTLDLQSYQSGQSWRVRLAHWLLPNSYYKDADGYNYMQSLGFDVSSYDHQDVKNLIECGYVTNPHVYAVVNNMLTALLQIPWYVYEIKDKKEFKRYSSHKAAGNIEEALYIEHKAIDVFSGTNSATRLLDKPNDKQTWEQFIATLFGMGCLTGNPYFYGNNPGLSSTPGVTEVTPLPSQYVQIIPTGNWDGAVDFYALHLSPTNIVKFKKEEICHIKDFSPGLTFTNNGNYVLGLYGQSPLTAISKVIRQSNDGYTAQMKLLQNGHPLGILSNASNEGMTTKEAENAENLFNKKHGGPENKGKIKLSTANLKWIAMGMNSVDLQLSQQQADTLGTVCAVYGLPAPNITGKNANFNTSKEGEKQKWNDAILPRLNPLVDHINRFLRANGNLGPGQFIDYDHHAVPSLQQDRERFVKSVDLMYTRGLINKPTANRMLGNEDLPAPHDNKWVMATNLRFTDEPLPGRTDTNNNENGKQD